MWLLSIYIQIYASPKARGVTTAKMEEGLAASAQDALTLRAQRRKPIAGVMNIHPLKVDQKEK